MRTTLVTIFALAWFTDTFAAAVSLRFYEHRELVPVRVELLDAQQRAHTASNAIPLSRDCAFAPLPQWLSQPHPRSLSNPFAGTRQHYVDGVGRYALEPGRYTLRAFRGPQRKILESEFEVGERSAAYNFELSRWIDLTQQGWHSTDVHLHIPRQSSQRNEPVAAWMSAEGLDIANLVQMGAPTHFAVTPQYAFGDDGTYAHADTLLISGQEHPRTHLFGHTLTLGADVPIDTRKRYTLYNESFAAARAAGGISGFAHWGTGPAKLGLALNVTQGNVEFLEVLGFEYLHLQTWYELLNLGFRIAAVAGTDFPCLPGIPGRERTYVKFDRDVSRKEMVRKIRAGRTFVSNGPLIDLQVAGHDIGSRVSWRPGLKVRISGTLRSAPARDEVHQLELVYNGIVIRQWPLAGKPQVTVEEDVELPAPGWVALRASGRKVGETPPVPSQFPKWVQLAFDKWMSGGGGAEVDAYFANRTERASYAHTSPIYLVLHPQARLAQRHDKPTDVTDWLRMLKSLAAHLEQKDTKRLAIWDWLPYSDGVSAAHLEADRSALLEQIHASTQEFERRARTGR